MTKMVTPESEEFYVYLDSNETKFYPQNQRASYTYTLKAPVRLRGEWVVGLAEVSIPKPDNFNPQLEELLDPDLTPFVVPVPENNDDEDKDDDDKKSKKRKKSDKSDKSDEESCCCEESADVEMMQAFYDVGAGIETQVADNTLMAIPEYDFAVYVECDVCEHHLAEGRHRPILRRLHLERPGVYQEFKHIHYHPVKKHDFDTIHMDIKDAGGELISFAKGVSMCTLHFIRKRAA